MKNTRTNIKRTLDFDKPFLKNNSLFNYIFVVVRAIVNNMDEDEQFCK